MRKIAWLLLIVLLGTASFAAVKKAAKKSVAKPVAAPSAVAAPVPAPAESAQKNLAIGAALGFPTIKYSFNKEFDGQVGVMYASGGGASSTAVLLKVDYNLQKMGSVKPNIGAFYATNGAAAATTAMGITYGLGAMVVPNLMLGIDFALLNSLTAGGASTTGILGPGLVGAGIPGVFYGVALSCAYTL